MIRRNYYYSGVIFCCWILVFFLLEGKGGINHYGAWRVFFWGWGLDFGRDKDLFVVDVAVVLFGIRSDSDRRYPLSCSHTHTRS